MQTLQIQRTHK